MRKPLFITIEGIEGAGKSTAIAFIQKFLMQANIPHITTREPGGTILANEIRDLVLKHHEEKMCSDTELLLFFASRAQTIANAIKPALNNGKWVICDRFTDASYAYQGGGRRIALQRIKVLEDWVHGDLQPDITLLLDIPAATGLQRIKERKTKDRIEHEHIQFFERVRQVYLQRAKQFPQRFRIIDASGDIASVERQISEVLTLSSRDLTAGSRLDLDNNFSLDPAVKPRDDTK